MTESLKVNIPLSEGGTVSGLLTSTWRQAKALYLFAHGAGAGMEHVFMETMAAKLAEGQVATLRFQFPYMEKGSRRPDHRTKLIATWRDVIAFTQAELGNGPKIYAGGKSMGGRMCSQAFSDDPPQGVHGLIFLGWPLHPAGKPGTERAEHLPQVKVPMLFLQGSRDKLAEPDLLEPIVRKLPTATLHFVKGADHGFGVRKMDGRSPEEIFEELTDNFCEWVFS